MIRDDLCIRHQPVYYEHPRKNERTHARTCMTCCKIFNVILQGGHVIQVSCTQVTANNEHSIVLLDGTAPTLLLSAIAPGRPLLDTKQNKY